MPGRIHEQPPLVRAVRPARPGILLLGRSIDCAAQTPPKPAAGATNRDFAAPPVEPAFERALTAVKRSSGLRETHPGVVLPAWTPGLCLVVGFRTDFASKQFVHLVEVTTLDPRVKDARGRTHVPAGSTEGAWFLTSGVRALRTTHPTKTDRRMLAQVLAVGTVSTPSASTATGETP